MSSSPSPRRLSLRISSEANQGMRKYMEDFTAVVLETEPERRAFLAVFDGHGGGEAAYYARRHLWENIKAQKGFDSDDTEKVKAAIKEGFLTTHWDMWNEVGSWPKRKGGQQSTSGTTATVAIIRGRRLFIAHVGDSGAVLAKTSDDSDELETQTLTRDHKPECPIERRRIESLGGKVANSNGVYRVVWKRTKVTENPGPVRRSAQFEFVPFLAVSRSLGDLWSYDYYRGEFIVSPEPDIVYHELKPGKDKFLLLASDGLWGVMNGEEACRTIQTFEDNDEEKDEVHDASHHLIKTALKKWSSKRLRADNISAVIAFLEEKSADETVSQTSQTTATDIEDDGEETPPSIDVNESRPPLIRKLAYRCIDPVIPKTVKVESINHITHIRTVSDGSGNIIKTEKLTDEEIIAATSGVNSCVSNAAPNAEDSGRQQSKRKAEDTLQGSDTSPLKRSKTVPAVPGSSKEYNLVTSISSESLKDLKLDRDFSMVELNGSSGSPGSIARTPPQRRIVPVIEVKSKPIIEV